MALPPWNGCGHAILDLAVSCLDRGERERRVQAARTGPPLQGRVRLRERRRLGRLDSTDTDEFAPAARSY
jgi:hypothetical protein